MNNLTITGRTTNIPTFIAGNETKSSFSTFSIAFKDGKNSDGTNKSGFIKCKAYGKTAEFITKYITKGTLIAIVGSITCDNWTKKDGTKVSEICLNVSSVESLSTPKEKEESSDLPTEIDGLASIDKADIIENDDNSGKSIIDNIDVDDLPFL